MSSGDQDDDEGPQAPRLREREAERLGSRPAWIDRALGILSKWKIARPADGDIDDHKTLETVVEPTPDLEGREAHREWKPRPVMISDLLGSSHVRPNYDALWVLGSEDGFREGRAFRLAQQCIIGRAAQSDIRIERDSVSRFHALLKWSKAGLILRDTSSGNSLLLNGDQFSGEALLRNGDRIQIGQTVFEVVLVSLGHAAPSR